ncbi:MAG: ureidoglycolate lyase [Woeseia sp.]
MADRILEPLPLTAERFAPYGDVIGATASERSSMNEARFERFDDLAQLDIDESGDGHVAVSIVRSRTATVLPYRFDMIERHPLGSQAFIPLTGFRFIVVVAKAGESVDVADLQAFVTNGAQGINYHRGIWHMPLIALAENQDFLLIDRAGSTHNCEQLVLSDAAILQAP